jgi:hypothetical protein
MHGKEICGGESSTWEGPQKEAAMQCHENRKTDSGGMTTRVETRMPYPGFSAGKVSWVEMGTAYSGLSTGRITQVDTKVTYPVVGTGLEGQHGPAVSARRKIPEPRWCLRGISKTQCRRL